MWDTITDFFNGKIYFKLAGEAWDVLMNTASGIITKNPTSGVYASTWTSVKDIYAIVNVLAGVLVCLFFLYGYCRECVDLHTELTLDRTIKMFIRLIITVNVVTYFFSWIPDFMKWAKDIAVVILGIKETSFSFNALAVYEELKNSDWGTLTIFFTGMLFCLFSLICGFIVVSSVLSRVLKIYMIAPFCSLSLSTLAGGGQLAQVGYSYIRTFFGYVLSVLLIAAAIVFSTTFINTLEISSDSAVIKIIEYCLKILAITTAVKSAESVMTKAFNL